jgi:hypothetical protein
MTYQKSAIRCLIVIKITEIEDLGILNFHALTEL